MFRSRKSRESRTIDPSAFAAASSIGKALVPSKDTIGGQVIDHNKIPRYSINERTFSMVNLGKPISRSNSTVLKTYKPRYGSLRGVNEDVDDVNGTFNEFGGKEGQYIPGPSGLVKLDDRREKPQTISKYVPSSHGLIKVEVSAEDYERQRHNSIKRSVSMHSGMNVKRGLLSKKSNSSLRSSSQATIGSRFLAEKPLLEEKDESGIAENRNGKTKIESSLNSKVAGKPSKPTYKNNRKLGDTFTKTVRTQKGPKRTQINHSDEKVVVIGAAISEPLITKEKLDTESIPSVKETQAISFVATENGNGPSDAEADILDEKTQDLKSNLEIQSSDELKDKPNTSTNNEDTVVSEECNLVEENSESVVIQEENQETITLSEQELACISKETHSSIDERQDAGHEGKVFEEVEQESKDINLHSDEKSNQPFNEVVEDKSKGSMAQYIRSANPGLQKIYDSKPVSRKPASNKALSPIKSAMKKTARSEEIHDQTPASSAYLSLTTRENTKLNAQISSENLRDHSNRQPASLRRNHQRPQSVAVQSLNGNRDRRSMVSPKTPARNPQRPASTILKNSSKPIQRSSLYPEEPLKKSSSFEKQRPGSTNLGFKKLSLRDEFEEPAPFVLNEPQMLQTPKRNSFINGDAYNSSGMMNQSPIVTPVQKLQVPQGFKSRFADSDSDEDSANVQFSSGASRSTQITAHSDLTHPDRGIYKPSEKSRTLQYSGKPQPEKEHTTTKKRNKFGKLKKLFGSKKY